MKNKWISIIAVIVFLILLISFIIYINNDREEEKDIKIVPLEHLPGIVLSTDDEIFYYEHDNRTNTYDKMKSYNLLDIIGMEEIGDNIIVNHNKGLTLLDHELEIVDESSLKIPKDIGVYDDVIYCCSNSSLYSISPDLEIMNSIYLNTSDWVGGKDAHDIIIHNGSAYLLDNVVYPIFVFKINISNPDEMIMDLGFEITGINQHLRSQWLDTANNRWFILQHECHQGGTYQNIQCYSSINGSLLWNQETFGKDWWNDGAEEGFKINAVTEISPGWMLTSRNDVHSLMYYRLADGQILFKEELDLRYDYSIPIFPHCGIEQFENLLFITICDQLVVVNIEDEPVIVLSQTFPEPITDVCILV